MNEVAQWRTYCDSGCAVALIAIGLVMVHDIATHIVLCWPQVVQWHCQHVLRLKLFRFMLYSGLTSDSWCTVAWLAMAIICPDSCCTVASSCSVDHISRLKLFSGSYIATQGLQNIRYCDSSCSVYRTSNISGSGLATQG